MFLSTDAAGSDVVAESEASAEDKMDDGSETEDRLPTPKRAQTQNPVSAKESESVAAPVNPIVSVVLAAHEAIPGKEDIRSLLWISMVIVWWGYMLNVLLSPCRVCVFAFSCNEH